ncbi:Gfo/Idh/MocA family protein [candidate division KSB1 bacterium]
MKAEVRVGFIGVGSRGTHLLRIALDMDGVIIPSICDINKTHLERAQKIVEEKKKIKPSGYSDGPEDFRAMVEQEELDAVIIATPWEWHTTMAVASMEAGVYAATEVPAAMNLSQCRELVATSERTGVPCMMLENVCYFRDVMMVQNMIRRGLFGELIHCEAGYQHDCRYLLFQPDGRLRWSTIYNVAFNGNLYPTHPIGPVARWMNINRGDRFTRLVSMSSKSASTAEYAREKFGSDHPNAGRRYAQGDVNTTLIKTEKGRTVTLYYDSVLPRPYDLIFRVQGTGGIYQGTLNQIYIEGASPEEHAWEDIENYREEYDHPFWKETGEKASAYGHGGADYFTVREFLKAVKEETQTPQDVYDAATWSAIIPLSIESVSNDNRPVDFPDFTGGKWETSKPATP